MASVRCTDVQARPTEFLDLTSSTLEEFQQLVLPCEAAWRLMGNCELPAGRAIYSSL